MPIDLTKVPETVSEAIEYVCQDISEDERQYILAEGAGSLHHWTGRDIRNAWGLWHSDSKLHKSFKEELGLWHADDMSSILIEALDAKVNGETFDPKAATKKYLDYWKKHGYEY